MGLSTPDPYYSSIAVVDMQNSCSILAALLAVLAGSYAFYTNDESYDNSFSSFGRVLQGDDIAAIFGPTSTNVEKENCRIAKRRIRLYGNRTNKRFKAEDPAIT
jgi:predicted ribosomally synthesized peptide with SipW-like signal peptide